MGIKLFRHGLAFSAPDSNKEVVILQFSDNTIEMFDIETQHLEAATKAVQDSDRVVLFFIGEAGDFLALNHELNFAGKYWVGFAVNSEDEVVNIYERRLVDAIQAIPEGCVDAYVYRSLTEM